MCNFFCLFEFHLLHPKCPISQKKANYANLNSTYNYLFSFVNEHKILPSSRMGISVGVFNCRAENIHIPCIVLFKVNSISKFQLTNLNPVRNNIRRMPYHKYARSKYIYFSIHIYPIYIDVDAL